MIDPPPADPVLVCFAVPDESRQFRAAVRNRRKLPALNDHPFRPLAGDLDGRAVTVLHTGVGDTPAARAALAGVLAAFPVPPAFVVSAGYAGGLDPRLAVGDLLAADNFSSPDLLQRTVACLAGEPLHVGILQSEPQAAESAGAKAALHRATGASAVDMESVWIAAACRETGLPLLSLRVISDAAGDDFPVPSAILYNARRQRPRYLALPLWLALHPGRIAPFARFVRNLGPARERLTHALLAILAGR